MIERLNDDCQLLIINYLELADQVALWEATADIAARLNRNVTYVWQHQLSYNLQQITLREFDKYPKAFESFLSSIGPTVQELNLRYITVKQLERWVGKSFPSMGTLKYVLDDLEDAERALKLFVTIFPGLHNVTPFGAVSAKLIAKWTNLQQLDLNESCILDGCAFLPKLQLLEELAMDCDCIQCDFIDSALRLPKLRTLCLHINAEGERVLDRIIEQRGDDIQKLSFNDIIWNFRLPTLQKVTNLRQLTLIEDDGLTAAQLQSLVTALPQLEQLNLIDFQCWRIETELWQIVAGCRSLNILNISGMQLYADFFEFSRRPMEAALYKRSAPLFLHLHNTGAQKDMICQRFKHSKLVLSFEPLKVDSIEESYIKIHFVPLRPSNS